MCNVSKFAGWFSYNLADRQVPKLTNDSYNKTKIIFLLYLLLGLLIFHPSHEKVKLN